MLRKLAFPGGPECTGRDRARHVPILGQARFRARHVSVLGQARPPLAIIGVVSS